MGRNDLQIMELIGHKTLWMRKREGGLGSTKRVAEIGERLAAAELPRAKW